MAAPGGTKMETYRVASKRAVGLRVGLLVVVVVLVLASGLPNNGLLVSKEHVSPKLEVGVYEYVVTGDGSKETADPVELWEALATPSLEGMWEGMQIAYPVGAGVIGLNIALTLSYLCARKQDCGRMCLLGLLDVLTALIPLLLIGVLVVASKMKFILTGGKVHEVFNFSHALYLLPGAVVFALITSAYWYLWGRKGTTMTFPS